MDRLNFTAKQKYFHKLKWQIFLQGLSKLFLSCESLGRLSATDSCCHLVAISDSNLISVVNFLKLHFPKCYLCRAG